MLGTFQHTIDAKGRLFIPARLREELGDVFYVTISNEECLWGFTPAGWENFKEKMRELPILDKKKMRPFFTHAAKCDLDGQGRILLSQFLREFAHLDKNVTINGVDECVEFWDSDTWTMVDEQESTPENISGVLSDLTL